MSPSRLQFQKKHARLRVLTVFGTRPEAIKMAPVVEALQQHPDLIESRVCVTAQHRGMLDQVLSLFGITPDVDLDLMQPDQDLYDLTSRVLLAMRDVLKTHDPDVVLVHGDTTTTMAASLACFYAKIPVGHVEAGLRTFDPYYPFPEEMNRVVADWISTLHFAPTQRSKQNLLAAGADESSVILTGNTVIDALLTTLDRVQDVPLPVTLDPSKRMVLITVHRRENFGEPLTEICAGIKQMVDDHPDVEVVWPVHPNPHVKPVVEATFKGESRVHLIEPTDYAQFCQLLNHCYLVLTDSGGIQEEAPSLKKPVLVLRDETERPEAVEMGTVELIGPHKQRIIESTHRLLTDASAYDHHAKALNPYGDGYAAQRIVQALAQRFELSLEPLKVPQIAF